MRKPLRIGVFSDSPRQSRWIFDALARAASGGHAEIALLALKPVPLPSQVPLLWRAYRRADRALFGSRSQWNAVRDLRTLATAENRIAMNTDERCWRARVRAARLDVAFVVGPLEDAALDGLARYGTWRFCFGEDHATCEPLAGVREVIEGRAVTASGIRIRPGGGKPDRVAHPSWGRTFDFSVAKSRDLLFAKTAEFLERTLRDLHEGGPRWMELNTEALAAPATAQPAFPPASRMLRDISRLGARVARRATEQALTVGQWSIAFRFGGEGSWDGSLEGFHRLEPAKGGFWADPFPIQVNGRNYIFFEDLPAGSDKGHISVVEVDRDGGASEPVRVLERDYHLSYPFLVEEDGQLYMIPETAANQTVEIYRCVEFPTRWKLERVLLKGVRFADATVHRLGDRWWMFANAAAQGEAFNEELSLFSAERLLGEWKPHRRNPVKSDVRGARPAGSLFWDGNRLFRPGQICTPIYGSGITVNRVTRLNLDEYHEEEDHRIVPRDARTLGIHTFNRAGDLTVADAFERRPRF